MQARFLPPEVAVPCTADILKIIAFVMCAYFKYVTDIRQCYIQILSGMSAMPSLFMSFKYGNLFEERTNLCENDNITIGF
jgi:hypothetical protein